MIFIIYIALGIIFSIARHERIKHVAALVEKSRNWRFLKSNGIEIVTTSFIIISWPLFLFIELMP